MTTGSNRRGRKARSDRTKVRGCVIEFSVTSTERERLNQEAYEDGCTSRAEWIREQCGLPAKLEEEDDDS